MPTPPGGTSAPRPSGPPDPAQVEWANQVKARQEDTLLRIPGVVGTGVGVAPDTGEVVIQVYVIRLIDQLRQAVPTQLEGVRVQLIETGQFEPR